MRQAIRKRFAKHKSEQSKKSTKSEQSKKSKKPKKPKKPKKVELQQVVARESENPRQSKKAKLSFKAIMDSWDKVAKARASDMEQAEPVVTSTSAETTKPLQSFLRPSNIVGGSFARTPTGCVAKFVHEYWTSQVQSVA